MDEEVEVVISTIIGSVITTREMVAEATGRPNGRDPTVLISRVKVEVGVVTGNPIMTEEVVVVSIRIVGMEESSKILPICLPRTEKEMIFNSLSSVLYYYCNNN